ncbi:MAG: hypothetical protein KIT83_16780 [Bryobacterales bacterium]|nr:hypothetical protein [Bryobacterales bacterium]
MPTVDTTSLVLIGAAGVALAGVSAVLLFRKQPDADTRERLRLQALDEQGRLAPGDLDEVRDRLVFYSYEVAGVYYSAAQDLSIFPELTDEDLRALNGPLDIKFERSNPPNSMVHSTQWSGLGLAAQPTLTNDSNLRRQPQ